MKQIFCILAVVAIVVITVLVKLDLNNPLIEGRQRGSQVASGEYSTYVELVVKHEGRFVQTESGNVYSLPRLWRSKIENLEGKKIQIFSTHHLRLPKAPSWRINGEEIIGWDVVNRGASVSIMTDYDIYTYTGRLLAVYSDVHSDIYRIYCPHRYVPKKKNF